MELTHFENIFKIESNQKFQRIFVRYFCSRFYFEINELLLSIFFSSILNISNNKT